MISRIASASSNLLGSPMRLSESAYFALCLIPRGVAAAFIFPDGSKILLPISYSIAADAANAMANRFWGDQDPITRGADEMFQGLVPGAKGQPHVRLDVGHNLPEDAGAELGRIVAEFALRR